MKRSDVEFIIASSKAFAAVRLERCDENISAIAKRARISRESKPGTDALIDKIVLHELAVVISGLPREIFNEFNQE